MDLEVDDHLLAQFQGVSESNTRILELEARVAQLQAENKELKEKNDAQFQTISKQADVIRRYRHAIETSVTIKKQVSSVVTTVALPQQQQQQPPTEVQDAARKRKAKDVDSPKPEKRRKKIPPPVFVDIDSEEGETIPQPMVPEKPYTVLTKGFITYPETEEDYPKFLEGRDIFTACKTALKHGLGGFVTEADVIAAAGDNALTDEPVLTVEQLCEFFDYGGHVGPKSHEIMVRRDDSDENRWHVFMPEWLRENMEDDCILK